MASSFAASGLIELTPALAVMLGANIGTTLVVQLVSLNLSSLFPVLMFIGAVASGSKRRAVVRDIGRALIGLSLMLLALRMLVETMQPLEASDGLRDVMQVLTHDSLITILFAAALAWASHSSVAIVIFIMSLAATGVVSPEAALRMVIGANIGGAINPILSEWGGNPARLRLPVGNMINRLIGGVIALPLVGPAVSLLGHFPSHGRVCRPISMCCSISGRPCSPMVSCRSSVVWSSACCQTAPMCRIAPARSISMKPRSATAPSRSQIRRVR